MVKFNGTTIWSTSSEPSGFTNTTPSGASNPANVTSSGTFAKEFVFQLVLFSNSSKSSGKTAVEGRLLVWFSPQVLSNPTLIFTNHILNEPCPYTCQGVGPSR